MADTGSLKNLNDIVSPGPVGWLPPAPGWYVLAALLSLLLLWALFRGVRSWQRNRYRREARRELERIVRAGPAAAPRVPELLKRAAVSAWPREKVAHLAGSEWHRFLDRTAATERFSGAAGRRLEQAAYEPSPGFAGTVFESLCDDARFWLRHHRPPER